MSAQVTVAAPPVEKIPVFVPYIGVDTLKHLTDALDVGWLGMGATTKEFEERIGGFLGTQRYVVATNTGTSALHIAVMAAGIGPGDEVITPSFNYVADHQAINMAGASVVMCDIRDDNLGIDCEKAERLIGERTKAIMPLHFAGIPCDQDGVYALARKYGLRVIEDSTHAFGSSIDGRRIGSYGDISVFSFDPVKLVTSVDGGCIVLESEAEYHKLHHLRLLGVDKDTTERYKNSRAWDYDVVGPGYRYHLTNIMASVGISQLKRAEDFLRTRRDVCRRYSAAFEPLDAVTVPKTDFSNVSPFIYCLRVSERREQFIEHMKARNVDVGRHFIPVHRHTYYASARRGDMTVTERVAGEVVTLPLHSYMRPDFVDRVIEGVVSFFN